MLTTVYKILMMWTIPISAYYYYKDSEVMGIKESSYWNALRTIWDSYWTEDSNV